MNHSLPCPQDRSKPKSKKLLFCCSIQGGGGEILASKQNREGRSDYRQLDSKNGIKYLVEILLLPSLTQTT